MIWTRVTIDDGAPADVSWTMARDHALTEVVASGSVVADQERDHTVNVDVTGLEPDTTYFYRFQVGDEPSPTARTRTLPGKDADHIRFAVASCASYNSGFFNVYGRIAAREDLNFVLHLGDYVYETPNVLPPHVPAPPDIGRPFDPADETVTLADYRLRYAHYRTDADLLALHHMHPIIPILDDHEYADGAWREGSSWHKPEYGPYMDRKAAAQRARWEWMPIRMPEPDDHERIYRSVPIGDFVEMFLIDTRTHRDIPIAPPTMNEEWRTALGPKQRDWLFDALEKSKAHWRLIANASVMGQTWTDQLPEDVRAPLALLKLLGDGGVGPDPDQWDGYPVERAALMRVMDKGDTGTVVVLSGDVHVAIALELHEDSFSDSDPVAVEFVTASITSMNLDDKMHWPRSSEQAHEIERKTVDTLPHWKWCEFDSNGYMLVDVTHDRVLTEWWFMETVLEPSAKEELAATWMVEHGKPIAVPVTTT